MDRHWSLLCILLANAWDSTTAATSHLRYKASVVPIGPDPASLQVPDCTCGCCHTAYRTPDELAQGGTVFLKCALNEVQSHGTAISVEKTADGKTDIEKLQCQTTCINRETYGKKASDSSESSETNSSEPAGNVSEGFGLVTSAATADSMWGMGSENNEVHPMDYNGYCAYNCRPYDFSIGNVCVNLDEGMKKLLKGEIDPAVAPKITDPAVRLNWDRAQGISPPPPEAVTVTTTPLPCEASDPCAYGMMDQSIKQAEAAYRGAEALARANIRTADEH